MAAPQADEPQYSIMARIYDRWMEQDKPPYDEWAAYILAEQMRDAVVQSDELRLRILEIGCGTGNLTKRFDDRGHVVVGVDASLDMIELARAKTWNHAEFLVAEAPSASLDELDEFDLVVACFDTLNYCQSDEQLAAVIAQAGGALRRDGMLIFDLNTKFKLSQVFGRYHSGDDFGDFGYVWRNRYDADTQTCEVLLTFYVDEGNGLFRRYTERHSERWFSQGVVRRALRQAGFAAVRVTDSYTSSPVTSRSLRATWIARKEGTTAARR